MQAFLIVSLAVAALAESDPQLLLNPYTVGSAAYVQQPLAYHAAMPAMKVIKPVVYTTKTAEQKMEKPVEVKTYTVETAEKKFEVPALSYKTPVVGTVASPVATYSAWPYVSTPVTYNAYTTGVVGTQETIVPASYHSKNGEVKHTVFKREAEADPALLYTNAFNGYYPYAAATAYTTPYVSSAVNAYTTYPYAAAKAYATYPYVQSAYAAVPVASSVKTYANDAVRPENYASKGQYVAQSAGAIHVAKRSAEADPAVVYANAFTGYPYASSLYNYNSAVVAPRVYSTAAYPSVYNYNTLGYRYLY